MLAADGRWNWPPAGISGVMVSIIRQSNDPYRWSLGTVPLAEAAVQAKPMPPEYIHEGGNDVTPACIEYLRPLVGPMPEYVRLRSVWAG